MHIKQSLISPNMYDYKCPYSMRPIGITVHNTANDASAANEIAYMKSNYNEVSYHIAVDDKEAIQAIPFNRNAWHASDGESGTGNRRTIAIEICYSRSGGERFIRAEKNAANVIAQLLIKYGWNVDDNVRTHQFYARDKKYCPHRTLDMGWNRFLNMVRAEYNALKNGGTTTTNPSTDKVVYRIRKSWTDVKSQIGAYTNVNSAIQQCPKGYSVFDPNGNIVYTNGANTNKAVYRIRKSWTDVQSQIGDYTNLESAKSQCPEGYSVFDPNGNAVYTKPVTQKGNRYAEDGIFYFNTTVKIRTAPSFNGTDTGICYYAGENVVYHHVILNSNGYNWIEYTRSNGTTGYCAIRDLSTGEMYGHAE